MTEIENKVFTTPQVFSDVYNVTFKKCIFKNCKQSMLNLNKCRNVIIENCRFENAGGIYAFKSTNIKVYNCTAIDINAPMPRGQFFQANQCMAPIQIHDNLILCKSDSTFCEDIINFYKTFGTVSEKSLIYNNRICTPAAISKSGGGIMLGDNGGSFQSAYSNNLYNPGQYGIAAAGGNNIEIKDNRIVSEKTSISNVGIYVWKQKAPDCANISVTGNKVNWISKTGGKNPWWLGPDSSATEKNNNWDWEPDRDFFSLFNEEKEEEQKVTEMKARVTFLKNKLLNIEFY